MKPVLHDSQYYPSKYFDVKFIMKLEEKDLENIS